MANALQNWWQKELKAHPIVYTLLGLILLGALFIRVYRVGELMQFYFDQGRDALVIWDLWHKGKPFLIGPVTGLAGIFLGPFYYYLIAPFYLIGGGNPAYPAVFLAFLSVCALGVLYYLGWQMQSRAAGLIAATVGGFSYYMFLAGRWLSNPTPILFTSTLLLLSLWKIMTTKNQKWWLAVALLVGISLQFESASAVFYIPMVAVFFVWQAFIKGLKVISVKTFILSLFIFSLTLLPQLIFNFRHQNLLFTNFAKLFLQEKSFKADFTIILDTRLRYFWDVFSSKIKPGLHGSEVAITVLSLSLLIYNKYKLKSPKVLSLFLIFLGIPMFGYIFFQGNSGNIYDYYMTGYYLPMILLFSLGLGFLWGSWIGKATLLLFLILFFQTNTVVIKNYLRAGVDGPTDVRLKSERQSVIWVFRDAKIEGVTEYNVDVYVPPVIPYSYDYLFLWLGTKECGSNLCGLVKDKQLETIYLLYEVDPPHPERLKVWLNRYRDNTIIENQHRFGGVTIERRRRVK